MIERAATAANLGIDAHAHMLRHACGYKLANDGHDTRAIQAVSRPPQHSKHDALYRVGAAAVQGILSRLIDVGRPSNPAFGRPHFVELAFCAFAFASRKLTAKVIV